MKQKGVVFYKSLAIAANSKLLCESAAVGMYLATIHCGEWSGRFRPVPLRYRSWQGLEPVFAQPAACDNSNSNKKDQN